MANLAIISIVHLITILIWALDSKTLDAMVRSYTKRSTYLREFDRQEVAKDRQFDNELEQLVRDAHEEGHKEMQAYLRARSNHPTSWNPVQRNSGIFKDKKNHAFELDRSQLGKEIFNKNKKNKSFFFWTWTSDRFFGDR